MSDSLSSQALRLVGISHHTLVRLYLAFDVVFMLGMVETSNKRRDGRTTKTSTPMWCWRSRTTRQCKPFGGPVRSGRSGLRPMTATCA
jgi:hypothetical protein